MYARSYYPEKDPETGIPKNYGGTALRESRAEEVPPPPPPPPMPPPPPPPREEERPCADDPPKPPTPERPPNKNPWELPPPPKKKSGGIFDSLLGILPLGGFGGHGGFGGILPAVGAWLTGEKKEGEHAGFSGEDLLILAVAAILFFSKFGDKECALMLLLLLFIR